MKKVTEIVKMSPCRGAWKRDKIENKQTKNLKKKVK